MDYDKAIEIRKNLVGKTITRIWLNPSPLVGDSREVPCSPTIRFTDGSELHLDQDFTHDGGPGVRMDLTPPENSEALRAPKN